MMAKYLDYNATTPIDSDVQEVICETLKNSWGNPSSSYSFGESAKGVVEKARNQVAEMIGARSDEVIFTSGGTEGNNMVIQTVIEHFHSELNKNSNLIEIPHIISTNIEHDSIKLPLEILQKKGKAHVTFVPVSKLTGAVEVSDIINEIRSNTCLITVMLANNETGVIQPIPLLKVELDAIKKKLFNKIYIHTDAAQAIGKVSVDVHDLGVDYLTIVGHKFYGPRIGALYFKNKCPLYPVFHGGGQEKGYRPGTENTCMIAGLGKASELVSLNLEYYQMCMSTMRDYLEKRLQETFQDKIHFNFKGHRLPNTVSVAFDSNNITGKMLLSEASNVSASTGAACHTGRKPSAILIASGVSEILAAKTLRLSVGRETSKDDIDISIQQFKNALESFGAL